MQYLGIDVHVSSSTWCLLNQAGVQMATGEVPTTASGLGSLAMRVKKDGEVLAGQEVGSLSYFVHDTLSGQGVRLLSFNAHHLRMIAASRKKTDRRDAYWLAKALQTGMTPHPVYIPTGEVRELRELLTRRRAVLRDCNRWQYRARAYVNSTGTKVRTGGFYLRRTLAQMVESPDGLPTRVLDGLGLCQRQIEILGEELAHIEACMKVRAEELDAIERLQTIPGIGHVAATSIYAWVGDVSRFPNAKSLCAYSGLVPTVRQSGSTTGLGSITKEGSKPLRSVLVQAAHVVASRCRSEEAKPLQAIYTRIRGTRGRRKVAIVALARHLLRIAYYVLRDGSVYDASRLRAH